ncbi:MAG: hypothetical protein COB35_06815 [Gammaproteobacteria bacterium]|nr:MAG: hypothetical protein COB35_06815 [Gammaproteobacteria bacterium]
MNNVKHNVSFENAIEVFKDALALTIYDEEHSDTEERWITLGKTSNSNVLLVVHTYVEYNSNQTNIRIISARKASNKEKKYYQK